MSVPTPTPTPTPPSRPKREYDQILSGDVKIKKLNNSNKEYEIKFSKKNISKVLIYQTWSSTSAALNSSRRVGEVKAKNWVKLFFPKTPYATYAIPFTPTTVMEIGNNKHVFVINNAKVKEGRVVFYVSSKNIDPNNTNKVVKKLKKIPTTKKGEMFRHVRFDIDDSDFLGVGGNCSGFSSQGACDSYCQLWAAGDYNLEIEFGPEEEEGEI